MKYFPILLILSVLCMFSSCSELNKEQQPNYIEKNDAELFRDFVHESGLQDLIISQVQSNMTDRDAQPWIENYKATVFQYEESRKLNGYRLMSTVHMIRHTDFLERINDGNADFLLEVYNGFKTKGSLESKQKMLVKLAEYYPEILIKEFRSEAYVQALEAEVELGDKLAKLNSQYEGLPELDIWQEVHLQEAKDKVEETKSFMKYFYSES